MSDSERRSTIKFEEEGDAGFCFTRKKNRQHARPRRSSSWKGVDAAELQSLREREDLDKPEVAAPAVVVRTQAPVATAASTSLPRSADEVALYRSELKEKRQFLAETRAEISAWQTSLEQHQKEAESERSHLVAAQSAYSSPISSEKLSSLLSEDHLRRLRKLPDSGPVQELVENRSQRLTVVTDRIACWSQLCSQLTDVSHAQVKQRREELASTARDLLGVGMTPVKLTKLIDDAATPAMRVTRRMRKLGSTL